MKKIKNILIVLVAPLFFYTACVEDIKVGSGFLDKGPGVDVNIDSIFSKSEHAKAFLWNAYRKLYYAFPTEWGETNGKMNQGMFECLSDCWNSIAGWSGGERYYYSGSYSAGIADYSDTRWRFTGEEVWECVRKCWIFIENIDRVQDMTSSEKDRLIAEAKIMIAMRYFDVFRHYGGLPLIDHAFTPSENTNVGRATVEKTVDFMLGLLNEAIDEPSLPWVLPDDEYQNWDGRMTKAAAYGLKCKIMCFAASPLFNDSEPYCTAGSQDAVSQNQVWYGGYKPELWTQTKTFCEDFFKANDGSYHLYENASDYRKAFQNAYFTRGAGHTNPEMIVQIRYRYKDGANWNFTIVGRGIPEGFFCPTLEYVDMFPMADGRPFAYDWDNIPDGVDPLSDRDPRLYETILVNGVDNYYGRRSELWVGGRDRATVQDAYTNSGFGIYKHFMDYGNFGSRLTPSWPYLRMAEIHLIYAEALAETGDLPGAIAQVDKVRARVGLKGLKESNPTGQWSDKSFVISEILRERACELGFEDTRLFDMTRRKLVSDFRKPLHGLNIYRLDENGNDLLKPYTGSEGVGSAYPTRFRYEKFNLSTRNWQSNWSPKWYLEAFPVEEVNKGYGLTQNPGW